MRRSRRSRRERENENEMIQAIKYWQRSVVKGFVFVLLPISLLGVAFALFINTQAGYEFMGWAEQDRQDERVLESLEKEGQKQLDEFTESTNEDVQNTIDDIQGATEDTTRTEYYNDDVYTDSETQEGLNK